MQSSNNSRFPIMNRSFVFNRGGLLVQTVSTSKRPSSSILDFPFFFIEAETAGAPQPHLSSAAVAEPSEAFLSFQQQHPTSYLQPRAQ
ncbi:hypothetical protein D5086_001791 [Populus alba]|uniref:Uncharacterized protein n=1 Tax=Populus alba TaxID=43335 RepID=A0ACC4CZN8_POPAL